MTPDVKFLVIVFLIMYVIFCYPRTGSTLLSKALDQHPNLSCGMEIFNAYVPEYLEWRSKILFELYGKSNEELIILNERKNHKEYNLDTVSYDYELFVEALFARFAGCKIISSQVHPSSNVWDWLFMKKVKFILLERDIFDSCASFYLAINSKKWFVLENETISHEKITITDEQFDWFIEQYLNPYMLIKERIVNNCNHIVISYNDLNSNWTNTCDLLCRFLGQKCMPLNKAHGKCCLKNNFENIANFKELTSKSKSYPLYTKYNIKRFL